MKIYERIVELLQAEDIDTLFGIPDPSFFGMFLTAEARGMRVVSPHHEQSAALMADGLYRMTGKPGVLGINKGPGVANIAAGAIYLAKENVPAIFIMAQRHTFYENRVRRGKTQHLPQQPLFENYMKYCGVIEYPEQVDDVIREAFRRAVSGVPGPVFVEMPLSVMQAELNLPPALPPHRYRLSHQRASDDGIAEATRLLKDAKYPVLVVGQGAFVSRAHESVKQLARSLACPILQTPAVEAVLEGFDDVTFPYGSNTATDIVAKADVVVAIGTEIGESLHYGRGQRWSKGNVDRKWIYIERDPTAIGVNRPIDVPLVGDLRDIVPQLVTAVAGFKRSLPAEITAWTQKHAGEKKAALDAVPTASTPIHPARLAVEATQVLPKDTIIVRDGGSSSLWFQGLMQFTPRDAMWCSNYGAVGPGLPYALGAQLGHPDRRVVLLTGDSSVLFHISEIETAVRKNLPVVCIVASDHAWGIEIASYKANFGENTKTPEAPWGKAVRLDKTAESFGAHGEYVDRAEDIGPAVQRALASGRPAIVHVEIDPVANQTFAGIPGFLEFRTWFGEEGDNLGVPGLASPPAGSGSSSTKGSGY